MLKIFLLAAVFSYSCVCYGKSNLPQATNNTSTANLNVTAAISTDSSGNVFFSAAAKNAMHYNYDFGNGTFKTVASGAVNYQYPASGTYMVNVKAKNPAGYTVSASISITVIVKFSLVWSDEFDVPGLPNPLKWGYDLGTGDGGWGNNELEYYTNRRKNAVVANGVLKITALKESYNGSAYTSARLLTKGKFSFKYGKIDVRAKLPAGIGTWPAIWMLGDNISATGWPDCGEADIMEHRGSELNKIFGTLHYPGHSGANGNGSTLMINNATTQFHDYILEWTPAAIKFYVDKQLYYTVTNTGSLPFNQKFFIILNVAIGGNFGGAADTTLTSAAMEIDYVRVYQ